MSFRVQLLIKLLYLSLIHIFATSLKMGDSSSTMSMVFMAGGTILFLWAVFRLFWRSKEWVYACLLYTSHLLMRHYDGLLNSGRIKGRAGNVAAY